MGFTNLNDDAGLALLDDWVQYRSYIEGFSPSQADVVSFKAIGKTPPSEDYPNACRWYNHIKSYVSDFPLLPGDPARSYMTYGPTGGAMDITAIENPEVEEIDKDEDQDDLFGTDEEEEEDPHVTAERERRLAEYRKKKEGKVKPPAKSMITLDIKPHGDDIDMERLRMDVLQIEMDGLIWGRSQFVPVGYGIRKLQINLVVEDEKVSLDELEEKVVYGLPDHVQSMDVVAMQKL